MTTYVRKSSSREDVGPQLVILSLRKFAACHLFHSQHRYRPCLRWVEQSNHSERTTNCFDPPTLNSTEIRSACAISNGHRYVVDTQCLTRRRGGSAAVTALRCRRRCCRGCRLEWPQPLPAVILPVRSSSVPCSIFVPYSAKIACVAMCKNAYEGKI